MTILGSFLWSSGFQPSAPVVDALGLWATHLQGERPARCLLIAHCRALSRNCLGERGSFKDTAAGSSPSSSPTTSEGSEGELGSTHVTFSGSVGGPAATGVTFASTPSLPPRAAEGVQWLRSEALGYCSLEDRFQYQARKVVVGCFHLNKLCLRGVPGA